MKKKLRILGLIFAIIMLLYACETGTTADTAVETETETQEQTEPQTETSTAPDDDSVGIVVGGKATMLSSCPKRSPVSRRTGREAQQGNKRGHRRVADNKDRQIQGRRAARPRQSGNSDWPDKPAGKPKGAGPDGDIRHKAIRPCCSGRSQTCHLRQRQPDAQRRGYLVCR